MVASRPVVGSMHSITHSDGSPPRALERLRGVACALVTAGCAAGVAPIPPERVLEGEDAAGFISVERGEGCGDAARTRVGLWGPTWGTPGVVTAEVEEGEGGLFWLTFPLLTGLGEGMASMRLQGSEVVLPLGGRAGEFDAVLVARPPDAGGHPATRRAELDAGLAERLDAEQAAWALGTFQLRDGEQLVGEIQLRGEEPPWVRVYDAFWLTPEPVVAQMASDGGDLLLSFPVEPQLEGELGLLRVNVASRAVVVPQDLRPHPGDRRLELVPGVVQAPERDQAIDAARGGADAAEEALLRERVPLLAAAAGRADGGCRGLDELDPAWSLLLRGYEVQILAEDSGCTVVIEPEAAQHHRRFRGRIPARQGGVGQPVP